MNIDILANPHFADPIQVDESLGGEGKCDEVYATYTTEHFNEANNGSRQPGKGMTEEGMTLIEIMIVLVLVALVSGGIGYALLSNLSKGNINQTKADVMAIRNGVILYLSQGNSGCPTVSELREAKVLDKAAREQDAWKKDFQVECEDGEVIVISGGEDGEIGTADDIKSQN